MHICNALGDKAVERTQKTIADVSAKIKWVKNCNNRLS